MSVLPRFLSQKSVVCLGSFSVFHIRVICRQLGSMQEWSYKNEIRGGVCNYTTSEEELTSFKRKHRKPPSGCGVGFLPRRSRRVGEPRARAGFRPPAVPRAVGPSAHGRASGGTRSFDAPEPPLRPLPLPRPSDGRVAKSSPLQPDALVFRKPGRLLTLDHASV